MSNDEDMSVRNANREEFVFYSKGNSSLFLSTRLGLSERCIRSGVTHKFPKPDGGNFLARKIVVGVQGIRDDQQGECHCPRFVPQV
jgi:hypothetical protein